MKDEIPDGITPKQWKYYQIGRKARSEGHAKDAAMCVFSAADRAWWYAGWHDQDLEESLCAIDSNSLSFCNVS